MPAKVERQRVMISHVCSWIIWRAVCWDHPQETDEIIAPWMSKDTHSAWIQAKLDATEHNLSDHPHVHSVPSVHDVFPERNSHA